MLTFHIVITSCSFTFPLKQGVKCLAMVKTITTNQKINNFDKVIEITKENSWQHCKFCNAQKFQYVQHSKSLHTFSLGEMQHFQAVSLASYDFLYLLVSIVLQYLYFLGFYINRLDIFASILLVFNFKSFQMHLKLFYFLI